MFIPRKLELYEVLPKDFYNDMMVKLGPKGIKKLWLMFDYNLLVSYDYLRQKYGTAILNTWKWGGANQLRGWRPFDAFNTVCNNCGHNYGMIELLSCVECGSTDLDKKHIGSLVSQHLFGRAFDIVFKRYSAEEVRRDILQNQHSEEYKRISCVEMDVSWLHIDTGNRLQQFGEIQLVYP